MRYKIPHIIATIALLVGLSPNVGNTQIWCESGARWRYLRYFWGGSSIIEANYQRDTVLSNGDTCRVISFGTNTSRPTLYTKLQNEVVYLRDIADSTTFDTLYHFGAVPGDRWSIVNIIQDTHTTTVLDTGRAVFGNRMLRWWRVERQLGGWPMSFTDTIVENIGALNGYMLPWDDFYQAVDGGEGGQLCGYESDSMLWAGRWGCPTALEKISEENLLSLSPNPASTTAQLRYPSHWERPMLEIYTALGQPIAASAPIAYQTGSAELPLDGLPSGMYVLRLRYLRESAVLRFIKL